MNMAIKEYLNWNIIWIELLLYSLNMGWTLTSRSLKKIFFPNDGPSCHAPLCGHPIKMHGTGRPLVQSSSPWISYFNATLFQRPRKKPFTSNWGHVECLLISQSINSMLSQGQRFGSTSFYGGLVRSPRREIMQIICGEGTTRYTMGTYIYSLHIQWIILDHSMPTLPCGSI